MKIITITHMHCQGAVNGGGLPFTEHHSCYTITNTFIDHQTRADLDYTLYRSSYCISVLKYADDTCLVANCPAPANNCWTRQRRDGWNGMEWEQRLQVSCCVIQGSMGHTTNPSSHHQARFSYSLGTTPSNSQDYPLRSRMIHQRAEQSYRRS